MKKRKLVFALSLFLLIFCGFTFLENTGTSKLDSQKKSFKVFNALHFSNMPDLTSRGFHKIFLIYENEILSKVAKSRFNKRENVLDIDKLKKIAEETRKYPNVPICLDVESWSMKGVNSLSSSPKYSNLLAKFREYNPESDVAFFVHNFTSGGILYPSFYTRNNDFNAWKADVIHRTKLLRAKYKSVKIYGFAWPQYNPEKKFAQFAYKFVDSKIWRQQLETLYEYCDGIVLWSPVQHYTDITRSKKVNIDFDEKMPWFQETLQFMKRHNIN